MSVGPAKNACVEVKTVVHAHTRSQIRAHSLKNTRTRAHNYSQTRAHAHRHYVTGAQTPAPPIAGSLPLRPPPMTLLLRPCAPGTPYRLLSKPKTRARQCNMYYMYSVCGTVATRRAQAFESIILYACASTPVNTVAHEHPRHRHHSSTDGGGRQTARQHRHPTRSALLHHYMPPCTDPLSQRYLCRRAIKIHACTATGGQAIARARKHHLCHSHAFMYVLHSVRIGKRGEDNDVSILCTSTIRH